MKYSKGDIVTVDVEKAMSFDEDFVLVNEQFLDLKIDTQYNREEGLYGGTSIIKTGVLDFFIFKEEHIIDGCDKHHERVWSSDRQEYICPFCLDD